MGRDDSGFMHIYSGHSIGEAKKKSLRSHGMDRALFFALAMVPFKSNLVLMREGARDTGSYR